jgi:hypothetical protein
MVCPKLFILKQDRKSPVAFCLGYSAVTVGSVCVNITVRDNIYAIPFNRILNHDINFEKNMKRFV